MSSNLQGISHEILKIGCLRYISTSEIPKDLERYCIDGHSDKSSYLRLKDKLHKEMPFIDYAASYVYSHAEHAQRHDIPTRDRFEIEKSIHKFSILAMPSSRHESKACKLA